MKTIILLISILFTSNSFAQYTLKSIESKRTGESITAFCEEFVQGNCAEISIKYIYPKKKIEKTLFKIDQNGVSDNNIVQNVIYNMESDQMMKNKYKVFATYRKVCEMGWSGEKHMNNFNDNTGCIFKTFFATAIFMGVALAATGPGLALIPAAKSLALGGVVSSAALHDLSLVQFFLFYPALATDIVRLVTVYPVRTLIHKVRTRTLKRKIIPVIEEMSFELDNPATLQELQNENLLEQDDYRVTLMKHRHFKKIKKFFMAEEVK